MRTNRILPLRFERNLSAADTADAGIEFTYCADCGAMIEANSVVTVHANGAERAVCGQCAEEGYEWCYGCSAFFDRGDMLVDMRTGDYFCRRCSSNPISFYCCKP